MSLAIYDDGFEDRMRRPSLIICLIAGAVVTFLVWAALAWVDEIVRAKGQIVSSSRPQIIQNLEGGILAELNVAEGDIVEPGQTIARLYGTNYQAAVDDIADQLATLEIRRLRLEAEIAGQDTFEAPMDLATRVPEIVASEQALLSARRSEFRARISGAEAIALQARNERQLLEDMYEKDVAPLIEVTRARKAASDAEAQLADAIGRTELERATEYSKTQGDLASLKQKLRLSSDQLARTILVAPMRGVVNKLSITTIGGVVRPGEEIMQIIPLDDELFVEAQVAPRDIASVREGQDATIKLSAYDYLIYGTLQARVTFISADTFKDERAREVDGDPHYKVTLRVNREALTERQTGLEIKPGMLAEVELQTGGKTVLTYLTKPLYKSGEALREP